MYFEHKHNIKRFSTALLLRAFSRTFFKLALKFFQPIRADNNKNSVMGSGMQLRPKQANPWRLAMKEFTKKGNLFVTSDWEAKLNKHYPRTPTEAANKRHFISPPKRK